ncbi:MAG: CoA ester lyase [Firmicutes bacterium]|nr:CoA ester lyase [Bacillota bacterium]
MYRSYLFSPASDMRKMEKSLWSGADAVILDLEDAVAPDQKDAARDNLARFLDRLPQGDGRPAVFVRVNGAGTPWFERDLKAVYRPQLAGYMIPKVESREDLELADAALTQSAGRTAEFEIVPFVESAQALLRLPDIVQGQQRVRRAVLGGEDLATDAGLQLSPGGLALVVPRALMAIFSRAAGLEPPVDTVYAAFRDEDGLRAELGRAKELGCFGKLAIHPAQVPVINEAFTPAAQEVAWARRVLDAFGESLALGRGVGSAHGAMVERPIAERARRLLALAQAVEERQRETPAAGEPDRPAKEGG